MGIVATASCAVVAITYWLGLLDGWTALPSSIHGAIGIALMLTLAPAVEEILFRGLLYRMLDEIAGRYPAIVISSVCFSLAHGMLFSPQLVGGLLFAWVYARTENLWLPILLHIAANGALVLMAR